MKFLDFNFSSDINRAIEDLSYVVATPIQEKSISHILDGSDVLGLAQTGTGKTAAFVLPILQKILDEPKGVSSGFPRYVILVPNRELAIQVLDVVRHFCKYVDINSVGLYGGLLDENLAASLQDEIDIVVATPGKLLKCLNEKLINLKNLDFFTLDEVDKMLDVDSIYELRKIFKVLPKKRQSLFFSATINDTVSDLVEELLVEPIRVEVSSDVVNVDLISQEVYFVNSENKYKLLLDLIKKKSVKSAIIFVNSRKMADELVRFLSNNGVLGEALHSQKSNVHREKVIKNINNRKIKFLIATDLASRGLDFSDISHVINFEIPNNPKIYIHRIGRTARAGKVGSSFTLCSAPEKYFLGNIEKELGRKIPSIKHDFFSDRARKAIGDAAKPKFKKKKDQKNRGNSNTVFTINVADVTKAKTIRNNVLKSKKKRALKKKNVDAEK